MRSVHRADTTLDPLDWMVSMKPVTADQKYHRHSHPVEVLCTAPIGDAARKHLSDVAAALRRSSDLRLSTQAAWSHTRMTNTCWRLWKPHRAAEVPKNGSAILEVHLNLVPRRPAPGMGISLYQAQSVARAWQFDTDVTIFSYTDEGRRGFKTLGIVSGNGGRFARADETTGEALAIPEDVYRLDEWGEAWWYFMEIAFNKDVIRQGQLWIDRVGEPELVKASVEGRRWTL